MTADRPSLSAAGFAAKWRENARRESASSQEHFIDLCRLLGVQTPNEADPTGEHYSFEAGAERTSTGGTGAADVWKRGHFGWEYKGAHADLGAAYRQLLDYREALENPPLLVVSDMDLIEVHTNFTGTRPVVETVTLEDLAAGGERTAEALRLLRAVMSEPEALRPRQTPDEVTELAAARFADIARSMQERGHEPEDVAHFLNRVLFCLFAEDVGLLPAIRAPSDPLSPRERVRVREGPPSGAALRHRGVRRRAAVLPLTSALSPGRGSRTGPSRYSAPLPRHSAPLPVIPAKAGIQARRRCCRLDGLLRHRGGRRRAGVFPLTPALSREGRGSRIRLRMCGRPSGPPSPRERVRVREGPPSGIALPRPVLTRILAWRAQARSA